MVFLVETAFLNIASHSYDDVVKFLQFLLAEFLEGGNRLIERQLSKSQIINFLFLQSEVRKVHAVSHISLQASASRRGSNKSFEASSDTF